MGEMLDYGPCVVDYLLFVTLPSFSSPSPTLSFLPLSLIPCALFHKPTPAHFFSFK